MKKTIITLIAAFLLSPMLMMAGTNASTIKTNPPVKQYTGYWVVTSGAEKIIMSEAAIPEEALVRDANGELVNLNMDVMDKTLNFSKQSTIQGKLVTANQFVLVETNAKDNAGFQLNTWNPICDPNNIPCILALLCFQGGTYGSFIAIATCNYGNRLCIVANTKTGKKYYTACR
jgi:hypothetical protein